MKNQDGWIYMQEQVKEYTGNINSQNRRILTLKASFKVFKEIIFINAIIYTTAINNCDYCD